MKNENGLFFDIRIGNTKLIFVNIYSRDIYCLTY